jgi:ubiquitin-protein ligase
LILNIKLGSMEGPSPRIIKETKTLQSDPVPGIASSPDPKNYRHFFVVIEGTRE